MDVQSDVGHVVKMLDCDKPDEDAAMPEADLPGVLVENVTAPMSLAIFSAGTKVLDP